MRRKSLIIFGSSIGIVVIASVWLMYTHSGKVTGLYLFSAFKAPLSEKVTCMRESKKLVVQKFELPLLFDNASKDALREFWHFSYYRACLFRAGYDFYGNPIKPSEIVQTDNETRYTNYFGGFSFAVPLNTQLTVRDVTDPDIEDRKIRSTLIIDGKPTNVLVYRNYEDATTTELLQTVFTHFENSTTTFENPTLSRNNAGIDILTAEDADGNYGFSALLPNGKIVQVYSNSLEHSLMDNLAASLQTVE